MRGILFLLSAALAATTLIGCAGSGDGKQVAAAAPAMSFSSADRDTIVKYYGRQAEAMPTSAKVGTKIEPGARPQHLPSDLHSRLKAVPEPYTWYVLGHDVVLVNRNTHEILDVVPSVAY
jgi:hypothetical protein